MAGGACLAAALAAALPAPADAAPPRTRIVAMGLKLRGNGPPGPNYTVTVIVRVRVCGRPGSVRLNITEKSSPPGRNRPVLEKNKRVRVREHGERCQTHRVTWRLGDRFFGVSRYRVGVRARTSGRGWSAPEARHIDTYD